MNLNVPRVREYLQNADLQKLFVEELGWDRHSATLPVAVDDRTYTLRAVAQKRGVQILECPPDGAGRIPAYEVRRKIENQVTKSTYEHLIVFADGAKTTQVWQWVARQPGQPAAYREHTYRPRSQSGNALVQKLTAIAIPVSEEEAIDLSGAVHRLRDAFAQLFDFFDQYDWHLDARPLSNDREINPDVLGYIFEKYINQKQMGAYYTKEDITDYISKNTIVPHLFDAARERCASAFAPGGPVWRQLADDPDRYLYSALRYGVLDVRGHVVALPPEIQRGVGDANERDGWGRAADAEVGLPSEGWREHVARRQRCLDLRDKLASGQISQINELITFNLDIRQFAADTIASCASPDLLGAFYRAISTVTVLDPTCGSGAFLFAALNILEPLYAACLDRMQAFVDDVARAGRAHSPTTFEEFQRILADVGRHPNRDYFILKSIIVRNLYGVDLMEEAVEICKLRLFLKLVAQVDSHPSLENHGLEPLPDIDFNIRSGNTLVGFATLEDVKKSLSGRLDFGMDLPRIVQEADGVAQAFARFHELQTLFGMDSLEFATAKKVLRQRLNKLTDEMNRYLAAEYGVDPERPRKFNEWISTHQPFHWFAEFYGIMRSGGFDVVIGNPPYVKASEVRRVYHVKGYRTLSCPDIYAWCLERVTSVLHGIGRVGMIVPLSLGFSRDFAIVRDCIFEAYKENWFSSFGRIPAALFNHDVRVRNTIHLASRRSASSEAHTTALYRWNEEARPHLFDTLSYANFHPQTWGRRIPKINSTRLAVAFESLLGRIRSRVADHLVKQSANGTTTLFFKKTAYNSLAFSKEPPPCFASDGSKIAPSQLDTLHPNDASLSDVLSLLLNGKIAFVFWCALGDDFHVTKQVVSEFPFDADLANSLNRKEIKGLCAELKKSMKEALQFKLNAGMNIGSYNLALCRNVTDKSDRLFARQFALEAVWEDIENYCSQVVRTDFSENSGDE